MIPDVVNDSLDLLTERLENDLLEYMVLDYTDAFYKLPLKPDERIFPTAFYKEKFYVWNRVAQGSRNGPQLSGRLSALVARLLHGGLLTNIYEAAGVHRRPGGDYTGKSQDHQPHPDEDDLTVEGSWGLTWPFIRANTARPCVGLDTASQAGPSSDGYGAVQTIFA